MSGWVVLLIVGVAVVCQTAALVMQIRSYHRSTGRWY